MVNVKSNKLLVILVLAGLYILSGCTDVNTNNPNLDGEISDISRTTPNQSEEDGSNGNQISTEIPHYKRKDNFTVLRVIIVNDKNQLLLCNDQGVWGMPWVNLTKRQYLNESIDSMANEYGIEISNLELRGQFCFKYDYKPNVTFRNYYVAQHKSGSIQLPKNTLESKFQEVAWLDQSEALEKLGVTAFKEITKQILENPKTLWGASFMVSHTDTDHPTKLVEEFYSLAELNDK